MFAKPFSLILVYIVTIFNIAVLASPILAISLPFMDFKNHILNIDYGTYQKIKFGFNFLIFLVSFLMLAYLVLDFLFGFSLRSSLKGCTRYEKIKDYDFLASIFDQVKDKFGEKNVKLYVKNSDEINAYAISSLGSRAIVLTHGLINHYLVECPDPKKFLYALRSIIGHEMSHLVNKDFLPGLLIITNQKVTNLTSNILFLIFISTGKLVNNIPHIGRTFAQLMSNSYSIINFAITSFNRFVVYNIYEFLRRFISRSIEYRCDNQSARAFGGQNMALALSMLGSSGYFTLFSTHPSTNARIKKVEEVKISESVVRAKFSDSIANYFSLMFLVIICLYFAKQAGVDMMIRDYIRNYESINRKLTMLWNLVGRIF